MRRTAAALVLLAALCAGKQPSARAQPASEESAPALSQEPAPRVLEVRIETGSKVSAARREQLLGQVGLQVGQPLSRDAVRDAIERLFTSGEFADVVVRAEPQPGGVIVHVQLPPQKQITAFTFQGASAVSRLVLTRVALSALGEGRGSRAAALPTPFFPERLEAMRAALQRDYESRGYASAEISARVEDQSETEVAVIFSIDEGPPTRIAALTAAGSPQLTPEAFAAALGLKLGDILDRNAVEAGLRRLRETYRRGNFFRASVGAPVVTPLPGRSEAAQLSIPVEAGPEIRFHFHGNAHFDGRLLATRLGYSPEDSLDEGEAERMATRVREFYVRNGFFDAQVVPEEVWSADRSKLVIIFDVDEGRPLTVKRVEFQGNAHFDNNFLVDRVHESLREIVPEPEALGAPTLGEGEVALAPSDMETESARWRVDPDTVFAESAYKDALARIIDLYRADGYLAVQVDLPKLEIDEHTRTAVVYVPVSEGPQTRIASVKVDGAPVLVGDPALAALKVGAPYNTLEEENVRLALARALQQRGYLFARVTTDVPRFSDDRTRVDVGYKAVPGPQVHVRSVIVRGNENTRTRVILDGVTLAPGDLFDAARLDESERNLNALGIFGRVSVHPLDPDHEDEEKDLVVEVDERARTEISTSFGGSLIDGPRASAEVDRLNLFGLGLEGVAQLKVNYFGLSYPVQTGQYDIPGTKVGDGTELQRFARGFGYRLNLGLRDPRIFLLQPAQVAGHVDLVAERTYRPAYSLNRFAFITGFDWFVSRWLQASLTGSIESDDVGKNLPPSAVATLDRSQQLIYLFPEGQTYFVAVAPSVLVDRRDNAANPHSGFQFTASAELAHSLERIRLNGQLSQMFYVKPTAGMTVYLPLGARTTLALGARVGRIISLASDSVTIGPKRFFLGGTNTLRGFAEDSMIPQDSRAALGQDLRNCSGVVLPTTAPKCTEEAKTLASGALLPSEGGQAFLLYKVELRFNLGGNLDAAVFADAGNLWGDPSRLSSKPLSLRVTPGFGLRYGTPIGPIALDTGFNLDPDTALNESTWSTRYIQFSIGLF